METINLLEESLRKKFLIVFVRVFRFRSVAREKVVTVCVVEWSSNVVGYSFRSNRVEITTLVRSFSNL